MWFEYHSRFPKPQQSFDDRVTGEDSFSKRITMSKDSTLNLAIGVDMQNIMIELCFLFEYFCGS